MPSTDSRWKLPDIPSRRRPPTVRLGRRPPRSPGRSRRRPGAVAPTKVTQNEAGWAPSLAPASDTSSSTGRPRPSLRPLSTLSAWRMRTGARSSSITAWASAASVGAKMVASTAAVHSGRPSSHMPSSVPATTVSGRPIPSIRAGKPPSRRSSRSGTRVASTNSTRIRVMVATASKKASSKRLSSPPRSPKRHSSSPTVTNTIGPLITVRSSRPETNP